MTEKWKACTARFLYGKTIVKGYIGGLPTDRYGPYDDKPYYYLELSTGDIVRFVSEYHGYTGGSEDEYPRMIKLERKVR